MENSHVAEWGLAHQQHQDYFFQAVPALRLHHLCRLVPGDQVGRVVTPRIHSILGFVALHDSIKRGPHCYCLHRIASSVTLQLIAQGTK